MATAKQVMDIARSQIGVKESPANSNRVKYWDAYAPYWQGSPWCDRFVSWCGWTAGASEAVGVFDYCPSHVNWFKAQGRWVDRSQTPKPGDVIFFGNAGVAVHVGLVESATSSNNVTTIEGNTSTASNDNGGAVMRRTRTLGSVGSSWYILGYGRPNYDEEEDIMATKEECAQAVWNYMIENWNGKQVQAKAMVKAIDAELQRTDDPSGNGVAMNLHDHLKWIAAKQRKMDERQQRIEEKLDELLSR